MADAYKIKQAQKLCAETHTDMASWVLVYTEGRTFDAEEMTAPEINLMLVALRNAREDVVHTMRKKIIHHLCVYGMTDAAGKPDMKRIDSFIKGIGSRNPGCKSIWRLSRDETLKVLNQVEVMVRKTINHQEKY